MKSSFLWRPVTRVALIVTLGLVVKLSLDAFTSPSPLNLFAAEVALFVLIGIALQVRSGDIERHPQETERETKRSHTFGLNSVFMVTLGVAVLFLWQSVNVPSPAYYIMLSLAFAVTGLEIVTRSGNEKRTATLILGKIVAIGVLVQVSFAWLNPRSVASDMYFDWLRIETIVQSGRIPEALGYFYYFPSFHVLNGIVAETTRIESSSYLLFNHLLMILALPAAYLLAAEITSARVALASTLLLVMSPFFFLSVVIGPALLGANLMILAFYALVKYQKSTSLRWWGMLWLLTLFAFFSHPVNALIFAVVLGVFWFMTKVRTSSNLRRKFAAPTLTYAVAYMGYLGFIAINAFTILLQSLFESGPRVYLAQTVSGPVPADFIVQILMSTLGMAILFLPATLVILSWSFRGDWRKRLLVGVVVVLASVPMITVFLGKGPYGLQAGRTILFLSVFVVVPAGSGLLYLLQKSRQTGSKVAMFVVIMFVLALFSSTSYLTGSGNRFLSESIPVQTSYATDSMVAVRGFLDRVSSTAPLTLDPALATFLAPHNSGLAYPVTAYPIEHSNLVNFPTGFGKTSVALALCNLFLANSGYAAADTSFIDASYAVRAYDNGMVRVYAPPGG